MDSALARLTAAARIVVGAALLFLPRLTTRPWIGGDAERRGALLLARALGARDLVLGAGALACLERGEDPGTWLRAALVADATDLGLTLAHFGRLPRGGRELVTVVAATGVAMGAKPALFPDNPPG